MCKLCGKQFIRYDRIQNKCPECILKTVKPAKPQKRISRTGKVHKATQRAVNQWSKEQKPNHQGYYVCVYCEKWILYIRAEHTESKARHPELRTDKSRFFITCDEDNARKGSMSAREYIEKYYPNKLNLLT